MAERREKDFISTATEIVNTQQIGIVIKPITENRTSYEYSITPLFFE